MGLVSRPVGCWVPLWAQTQAEVEEQQERIKKRRRESAQRSRARKNSYMKTLEVRAARGI